MPRRHKCASFAFKSEVPVDSRPTQVQLIRGEFLETVLYLAGVYSVRLGAFAEKKVSIPVSGVSVGLTASPLEVSYSR